MTRDLRALLFKTLEEKAVYDAQGRPSVVVAVFPCSKNPAWINPEAEALCQFHVKDFDGAFYVVGRPVEGKYGVCVLSDGRFKVWPKEGDEILGYRTRELAEADYAKSLIHPFAHHLATIGAETYNSAYQFAAAQNAERPQ